MSSFLTQARYPARVAALFDDAETARKAANELKVEVDLATDQVRIVDPTDPLVTDKLQPNTRSVGKALLRSHLSAGLLGMLAGLILALVMPVLDVAVAEVRPGMTMVTLAAIGAMIGLLAAGVATANPGLPRLQRMALNATRTNEWMVVALATDRRQCEQARKVLARGSDDVASAS